MDGISIVFGVCAGMAFMWTLHQVAKIRFRVRAMQQQLYRTGAPIIINPPKK